MRDAYAWSFVVWLLREYEPIMARKGEECNSAMVMKIKEIGKILFLYFRFRKSNREI